MTIDPTHRRFRAWLAVVTAASSGLLYAEGVLKSGWFEAALAVLLVWYVRARRPFDCLFPLLVGLASVSVIIACADLVLRPFMGSRLSFTAFNEYSRNYPSLPIVGRWDAGLHIVENSYGDLAALSGDESARHVRQVEIHTDASGFRNEGVPETIDLLVLGDSFGAGIGTSQELIFAGLLRRQGHRIYNLSYPGGPYDEFVNLAVESPRLRFGKNAKLIWTIYVGNDLADTGGEILEPEALPWQSTLGQWQVRYRTYRNRSPLNRLVTNVILRRQGRAGNEVTARPTADGKPVLFLDTQDQWSRRSAAEIRAHPNFGKLQKTFAAMQELTARLGLDVTVLIVPTKGDVYRWIVEGRLPSEKDRARTGFAEAVLDICRPRGFRCLDLKPLFVDEAVRLYHSSGELLWWRDDTHLGERGHQLAARFILDHVLNEGAPLNGNRYDDQRHQVNGSRSVTG